MNEDLEALTKMMDQLEKLVSISDKIDSNDKMMPLVELGKHLSDLEHRVKELEAENAFLRSLLKQQFGVNT